MVNPQNPKVFFDIVIGGTPTGRIIMELYQDTCPKTAENFRYTGIKLVLPSFNPVDPVTNYSVFLVL